MTPSTACDNSSNTAALAKIWSNAWETCLDMQGVWLMIGVHDTTLKMQAAGKATSCQAKWFDYIAPQAHQIAALPLPRFTARTVAKIPQFLTLSPSGYVELTEAGRDMVDFLYHRYPQLAQRNLAHANIVVPALGLFPAPLWLFWKSWPPL